jgi:uncharacterized protein
MIVEEDHMRRATASSPDSTELTSPTGILAARPGEVVFLDLRRDEIEEIISRNNVGRIAFAFHDRVDIQPIHYVYERGWLYGRTSEGEKIATLHHNQWVAFEIDEIKDIFEWRSVVIHGSFWRIHPLGSPHAEEVWAKAAELVSKLVPGALTERDPVGFRQVLFRIAVSDVRGREAQRRFGASGDTRQTGE